MDGIFCKDCVHCSDGRCERFGFPVQTETGNRLPFCKTGQKK